MRLTQVLNNVLYRTALGRDFDNDRTPNSRGAIMLRGDNNVVESNDADYINMAIGWCVLSWLTQATNEEAAPILFCMLSVALSCRALADRTHHMRVTGRALTVARASTTPS